MSDSIPRPSQVPAVVEKPVAAVAKVSDKDLDAACASLGLVRFRAKTVKALRTVGTALETEDMARVQAASIVINQERLSNLLEKLNVIIENAEDDQTVVEAVRAATAVLAEANRSCELAVKIMDTKLLDKQNEVARKFKGFMPGEVVQPIQVNIRADGDVKVERSEDA